MDIFFYGIAEWLLMYEIGMDPKSVRKSGINTSWIRNIGISETRSVTITNMQMIPHQNNYFWRTNNVSEPDWHEKNVFLGDFLSQSGAENLIVFRNGGDGMALNFRRNGGMRVWKSGMAASATHCPSPSPHLSDTTMEQHLVVRQKRFIAPTCLSSPTCH